MNSLGVDLAGYNRPLGYAVLDDRARLLDLGRAPLTDDDIVALAVSHHAAVVAIDAPLALPDGMCCLDEACPCAPTHPRGMRTAELALRAAGIGCYTTTKRTIIPGLVRRGMALRTLLESKSLRAIEVYPYGTKLRLFGRPPAKKTTPEGRRWVSERLRAVVAGLPPDDLHHDEADAVLAAYTGLLVTRGEAEALGDEPEGRIWLPPPLAAATAAR